MKTVLGDLQIVVDRHSDVLRNNALPFRILIALRSLAYPNLIILQIPFSGLLLSVISVAYNFLSLEPFQLFSIEVWRLLTCHFVGQNVLLFAWTIWSLHFGTNLVRQSNTNESLLKIYAITQVLTVLLICAVAYGLYAFASKTTLLYEYRVVDMFLPDSILLDTPLGRVKYTHMPFLAVTFLSIFSVVGVTAPVVVLQSVLAIQISWTYLRFFNPHESDSIYGDGSEHFVWASLFPRILHPFCTILGRICFRSLVKLGVCKRTVS
ncbi:unnamed protein product [Nippostrongylus brasiliensis]|uniref:Transmembrane protein 115 (inferred by orthology to a human protein) n=1 Tax=Nippostrongylus brasiliensis TaxID=27835 RepID=A0A0N4XL15_NIPBR|nr:unnamed protein product [Nippostrongylus brasiliensis]